VLIAGPVIFVHGIGNDASVYDGHFDGKDMHHTIYMVGVVLISDIGHMPDG
jgi:hypothetical protein